MKYSWDDYITTQRSLPSGSPCSVGKDKEAKKKREKKNKTNDELDKIFPLRVRLVGSNS